ncbi:hypothetical protein [Streptomyces sp. LMG1-1-1.1]|uniref:hypothetical protein n=1 Tax=Streptomyces sp. LMG1-1-1.1 TaxID=3135245 RepID=UPI0034658C04
MARSTRCTSTTQDRHWFDLGVGLEWAGERLQERIYEIDGDGGDGDRVDGREVDGEDGTAARLTS